MESSYTERGILPTESGRGGAVPRFSTLHSPQPFLKGPFLPKMQNCDIDDFLVPKTFFHVPCFCICLEENDRKEEVPGEKGKKLEFKSPKQAASV